PLTDHCSVNKHRKSQRKKGFTMPTFAYTARDASGGTQKGNMDADNEAGVARLLRERGLVVSNISRAKGSAPAGSKDVVVTKKQGKGGFGRVKLADLSVFCRQF